MKVCEKIKALRKEQGWSQEEMATKLGMSPNGYGHIERGETNPDLPRLEQIAELFGIDLAELFNSSDKSIINNSQNTHSHFNIGISICENTQLKAEVDKLQALTQQQAEEIIYLRGLVDAFLKKDNPQQ
jgi:transcriptional regulator with XRE-family HTH domain